MTATAALVPIPFYAPVYTGTGAFDQGYPGPPPAMAWAPLPPITLTGLTSGLAYGRDGYLMGDGSVGTMVDIYA